MDVLTQHRKIGGCEQQQESLGVAASRMAPRRAGVSHNTKHYEFHEKKFTETPYDSRAESAIARVTHFLPVDN